jgi:hypothetical protein
VALFTTTHRTSLCSSEQITTLISGLMKVMTAAQLRDGSSLIPGAYELNAPPHRSRRAAPVLPSTSSGQGPVRDASATAAHMVASPRPTTRLGQAVSILGDIALLMALIYSVTVVPALVVWGIRAAAVIVRGTFGGH